MMRRLDPRRWSPIGWARFVYLVVTGGALVTLDPAVFPTVLLVALVARSAFEAYWRWRTADPHRRRWSA